MDLDFGGNLSSKKDLDVVVKSKWENASCIHPPMSQNKMNFDEAAEESSGPTGCGVTIRVDQRNILKVTLIPLSI